MTPLTEENLAQAGYRRFDWNGGAFWEYWKPMTRVEGREFDYRLGVRFNEFPGKVSVYIIGLSIQRAHGVKSVEQLELLRDLLLGDES